MEFLLISCLAAKAHFVETEAWDLGALARIMLGQLQYRCYFSTSTNQQKKAFLLPIPLFSFLLTIPLEWSPHPSTKLHWVCRKQWPEVRSFQVLMQLWGPKLCTKWLFPNSGATWVGGAVGPSWDQLCPGENDMLNWKVWRIWCKSNRRIQ